MKTSNFRSFRIPKLLMSRFFSRHVIFTDHILGFANLRCLKKSSNNILPKMLVLLFADSSWYKIPASKNHKKKTSTQDLLVWDLIKGYPPPPNKLSRTHKGIPGSPTTSGPKPTINHYLKLFPKKNNNHLPSSDQAAYGREV